MYISPRADKSTCAQRQAVQRLLGLRLREVEQQHPEFRAARRRMRKASKRGLAQKDPRLWQEIDAAYRKQLAEVEQAFPDLVVLRELLWGPGRYSGRNGKQ